jgi:hypothetical protein
MHSVCPRLRKFGLANRLLLSILIASISSCAAYAGSTTVFVPTAAGNLYGTLSWTAPETGGACGPHGWYSYVEWSFSAFSLTIDGTTYPLDQGQGSLAAYFGGDGSSNGCPAVGGQPLQGVWISSGLPSSLGGTSLSNASIVFTPESGGSGSAFLEQISTLNPGYQVASILYSPPGNQSSQGYGSSTTNGTVSTVGNSFTEGNTVTFSAGVPGISGTASIGWSTTTSNSSAFTQTFTNAVTDATDDNSSKTYNPPNSNGVQSDALNHNLDTFVIVLNPQVTIWTQGGTPVSYETGFQATPGTSSLIADQVLVPAISMEANSLGVTTVESYLLNQQATDTSTGTVYSPGLASICKNLNVAEYQNLECTTSDQCGCTPADFAPILAQDLLLNYNTTTFTANPIGSSVSPLTLDASGATVCSQNPVPAGSDCRYVIVPAQQGSTQPMAMTFSGSEKASYTQAYSTNTTQTLGGSTSYTTGLSFQAGNKTGIIFSLKDQQTWTWTQMQSMGVSNGTSEQVNVNLQTSTASCGENVTFYQDTVFHTFLFEVPQSNTCP